MAKETQHTEFKPNFNEDVIETLVAFANAKGGQVLVGVDDTGNPLKNFTIGKESVQKWINEIKTPNNQDRKRNGLDRALWHGHSPCA